MNFKDLFSVQAKEYSKYRPTYPKELFEFLSSIVDKNERAWDCATGSGQCATGLVDFFDEVIATDASVSQIENAVQHPKIKYSVATAEESGLPSEYVDLITVATAIHWLDTEKFYPEAKRILKPNGVLAVWVYYESFVEDKINSVFEKFSDIVRNHWHASAQNAWNFEERIHLPFEKVTMPEIIMEKNYSCKDYMNYLFTWSSAQNYLKEKNENPVSLIEDELRKAWGDAERIVKWKLKLKAGRKI